MRLDLLALIEAGMACCAAAAVIGLVLIVARRPKPTPTIGRPRPAPPWIEDARAQLARTGELGETL